MYVELVKLYGWKACTVVVGQNGDYHTVKQFRGAVQCHLQGCPIGLQ